jgi:hypothetical protein
MSPISPGDLPIVSKLSDGRLFFAAESGPFVLEDGAWVPADDGLKLADVWDSKLLPASEIRTLMESVTFPQ